MKTLRSVLITAVLLIFTLPLFAFDWGVVVDNTSTFNFSAADDVDPENDQRNKVSLWAEEYWTPWEDGTVSLTANAYYLYTDDRELLIDLSLLKLSIDRADLLDPGKGVLRTDLGRFRFSDPSGMVFNHTADGAAGSFDFGPAIISAGVGYTGLQLKPEASVNMSAADAADEGDDDVYFAPKRLFEQVSVSVRDYLPRQKLTAGGLFQQDLRDDDGDPLNSMHLVGTADGSITEGLYYSLAGVYASNLSDDLNGTLFKAGLFYFSEALLNSRISGDLLVTGEDYFSVSEPTLGLVYTPDEADLLRVALDYSIRPWGDRFDPFLRNLQFAAGAKFFSIPGGDRTGNEFEGGIKFRPTSDFGAAVKYGLFVPEEGDNASLVRLEASLGL